MPRHTTLKKRMHNFWWNAEIDELRKVCLKVRRHSQCIRKWKLVLIPKPNTPLDHSCYRPICLVNSVGKLFEQVIDNRLVAITEREGGLSDRQFRIRKTRSTVNAISMVTKIAEEAAKTNKS